jgi:hypothetical protein
MDYIENSLKKYYIRTVVNIKNCEGEQGKLYVQNYEIIGGGHYEVKNKS